MEWAIFLIGVLLVAVGALYIFMDRNKSRKDQINNSAKQSVNGLMQRSVYDIQLSEMMTAETQMQQLLSANPNLSRNIQVLLDYYKPQRGVFTSWWHRSRADARLRLQESLNKEQAAYLQSLMTLEKQVIEGKKSQIEFNLFIAHNATQLLELKNRAALADTALGSGMNVEDFSAVNKEGAFSRIRMSEEDLKIEREKNLEAWRIEQNLSAAERYKMTEDEVTNRLRKNLETALIELDALEERADLSDSAKIKLKNVKESHIGNLEFRIKAREKRLADDES